MLVCCLSRQMVLESVLESLGEELEEMEEMARNAAKGVRWSRFDDRVEMRRLLKAVGEELERLEKWHPRASMCCVIGRTVSL